ncbi:unnamed protein product [Cladocopium goreaui]|uniref:Uncharacterized protein n=1 Tax=Cladocopium goreaui TaxID=2562237 RepID=A0A9P1CBY0_9DINO|nr:unnamed protein product [Cladocopium goreaui]
MTEGDTVILHVRNFDGLMDEDVKVRIGLVVVPSVTVTESSVMQVMVGWKGWADFAPFLELPYPQQQDNLMMQFDTLNEAPLVEIWADPAG